MNAQKRFDMRFRSMTVDRLIEALQEVSAEGNGGMHVVMTADYGDHCHTTQILRIGDVQIREIDESGYSDSGYALVDDEYEKKARPNVVALL